jgi:peroxiredoxin
MCRILIFTFLIIVSFVNATSAQIRTKPLTVGETAPDFTLVEHHGQKVTLSDSKGKNPVVLVFYRGYW